MMFNPFCPLNKKLLDAFVKAGKRYFVRQTFRRGLNPDIITLKASFLLSHYNDLASAEAHYNSLEKDGNRFLYDWTNPEHRRKLQTAASSPPGFKIFANVFQENWEKLMTSSLKQKARHYIDKKLGWQLARSSELTFDIYVQFGEPYSQIKFGNQEVRIKLEEVENFR